jgi:hypothetical protein
MHPVFTDHALEHGLFLLHWIIGVPLLTVAEVTIIVLAIHVEVVLGCKIEWCCSEIARLKDGRGALSHLVRVQAHRRMTL